MSIPDLDPPTLAFSVSVLGFFAAGLTQSLTRMHAASRKSVIAWSRAMLCVGAAFLLIFLRSQEPDYLLYIVANAFVLAFPLLVLLAYSRLFGARFTVRPLWVLYLIQVTGLAAFHLLETPRDFAIVALCTSLSLEFAMAAVLIVRQRANAARFLEWFTVATMLVLCLVFAVRVIAALAGAGSLIAPSARSSVQAVMALAVIIAIIGATIAFVLMVHERQTRETLEQARRDELTGLFTRKALFDELAVLERRARTVFSLVMVDIDHFKSINDRHGHGVGDTVLGQVGELIRRSIRDTDIAGRYGGEEFCVLLHDCDQAQAGRFAERLVAEAGVQSLALPNGEQVQFTLSAGYADGEAAIGAANMPDTIAQVLERADSALYAAKRAGRNQACPGEPRPLASTRILSRDILAV